MTFRLVTRREARAWSNRTEIDTGDHLIDVAREIASGLVLDFLKDTIDPDDTGFDWCDVYGEPVPGKVPPVIRQAVLMEVLVNLDNPGGDEWRQAATLSDRVKDVLGGIYKPAMG